MVEEWTRELLGSLDAADCALDDRIDRYEAAMNTRISAVRDLRVRFRNRQLSPDEYRRAVESELTGLRNSPPVTDEIPPIDASGLRQYIRSNPPG